ncbi:glutathione S-transferase family protein [Caballeronia sp. DA-9]|uniref:glutathione S-transferase family protein n=1 Tax=Caballeronia sp. DA-9 TaxID=3436237 RepID=UPI003F66A83F
MPATNKPLPNQPIRLHTTLLSGHGHRVKLFLTLLDLPFTTIELDMKAGDNRKPAHLALNPFGEVPVIEDGDIVLTDSNAILVYLARKYGDASWLPEDPVNAAAVQRWLSLAAGKIAYGPCAARLVTVFGAPRDHAGAIRIAEDLFAIIETEFRDKPFAVGHAPTIADIAAYSYIAHAPEGGISLDPYPNLRAWLKRVEALPRFLPMPVTKAGLLAESA